MALKLVIFDIDGTLTRTTAVDDACYLQAIESVFGIRCEDTQWGRYAHVTDRGIAVELVRQERGWAPSEDELASLSDEMCRLLSQAADHKPEQFEAISGAREVLDVLAGRDIAVAIATGAWKRSAHVKLASAGLSIGQIALSSSDDGFAREAIIMNAISQTTKTYGHEFSQVITVGDGIWDARASASLNLPFVARVDNQGELARFSPLTVRSWVCNYSEMDVFMDALQRATVPSSDIESKASTV